MEALTLQQKNFFETFGYLVFPGLIADEIDRVTAEFEAVFTDRGIVHDPTKRTCIVPFIDQREGLCRLLDDPRIAAIAKGVAGDDYNYIGSDGNYYSGDTGWHSDGFHTVGKYCKIAFYLDPVKRDTGALRVIPGTHRIETKNAWPAHQSAKSKDIWGIEQSEVPAISLDSNPGDVVVFNHNLVHSAFGGNNCRRMFTINICEHARTQPEVEELQGFINGNARFWIERTHSEIMRSTASPERMRHLSQVIENETDLPRLVAKARHEMTEPARG